MTGVKQIIVLGMHRSTTSLMAKGLTSCGVNIGDNLLGASESNPWGHFEDIDFVMLNQSILRSAGGSWDNPPTEQAILEQRDKFDSRIEALVKSNDAAVDPSYPLWGWKDPRTVLTIRLYLPHLSNPYFHCCFTKPETVAASLEKRDGMHQIKGIELAKEYNRRLLEFMTEWTLP